MIFSSSSKSASLGVAAVAYKKRLISEYFMKTKNHYFKLSSNKHKTLFVFSIFQDESAPNFFSGFRRKHLFITTCIEKHYTRSLKLGFHK